MKKQSNHLEDFYSNWYEKSSEQIEYEIKVSIEKSATACKLLDKVDVGSINSVLEIGCGFGRNLVEIVNYTKASFGLGCDVPKAAIEYAKKHYENDSIKFLQAESLDIKSTVSQISRIHSEPFDITILFDVLEHIPQPKTFIRQLASISKSFLIIVPLDNSVFNNYILPQRMKTYPSSKHPDGHFWEFHVNNVHHFIVSLGLTPVVYHFNKLSLYDQYPPHFRPRHLKGRIFFECMKVFKYIASKVLGTRIFLRLIGNGSFMCLATWADEFVLE